MSFHRDLGFGNVHVVHSYEYTDATARAAAAGLTPSDVGKVARQLDDDTFWVLQDDSPVTWAEITSSGSSVPTSRQVIAGAGLTGGGDLTADRTFNVVGNADGSIVANANDVQVGVLATDAQHGARGGGTQHATAIAGAPGTSGFISGVSQQKLNNLVEVLDESVSLGAGKTKLNFLGAGVSAVVNGGDANQIDVTVPGSGTATITVKDEGSIIAPDKNKLNFTGPGLTASTDGGDNTQANIAISTGTPGAIAVGDAASAGVADALIRSDHVHALPAPAAPANVTKAAAAAGVATTVARADHKHDVTTAAPVSVGDANAEGSATSLARSDHTHNAEFPCHIFGNSSVSATTTTRYLTPGYTAATATTTPIQYRVPSAGTIRRLRVRHNTGAGNGNSIVYTVRVNGVASAVSAALASTATDGADLTNTVVVAAGDLIDIEVTKAVSVGTSPSEIMASLEVFV